MVKIDFTYREQSTLLAMLQIRLETVKTNISKGHPLGSQYWENEKATVEELIYKINK